MRAWRGLWAVLMLCLCAAGPASAAAEEPQQNWRAPVAIDPGHGLGDVSCPTDSFCAAVDSAGNVVTATDPVDGAWRIVPVSPGHELTGISCPSSGMCAAIDDARNVWVSANPTGEAADWRPVPLPDPPYPGGGDPTWGLKGVSCPTPKFCAVVSTSGYAFTSTDPLAGTWTSADIDDETCPPDAACVHNPSRLTGVSCATPDLCVAIDSMANVFTSAQPEGGKDDWKAYDTHAGAPCHLANCRAVLFGVSCPAPSLCVAVGEGGNLIVSTDPVARSWTITKDWVKRYAGVSCPVPEFCVAVHSGMTDRRQGTDMSTDPASGRWTATLDEPLADPQFVDVSCASASTCVLVDNLGNARVATPAEPSRREIAAWLARRLAPHGKGARIGTLLRRNRYIASFDPPMPGELQVRWTARGVLVATGRHRFGSATRGRAAIRLTRRGRRMLTSSRRVVVTSVGAFTPAGGRPIRAKRHFAVRR